MSLIPDVLPTIHPIADLQIKLSASEREIVPGEFVSPREVCSFDVSPFPTDALE